MMVQTQPVAVLRSFRGRTEQELVEAAKEGDRDAWSTLFDENFQPLVRYAFYRVGDHHAAEELAAQTFAEALRSIKRFHYRGVTVRAWLFKIAKNVTAMHLRTKARRPTSELIEAIDGRDQIDGAATRADLVRALGELTDDQQQVIVLRFIEGLSLIETGHAIGKSVDAVSSLQARGLRMMRAALSEPDGPFEGDERGNPQIEQMKQMEREDEADPQIEQMEQMSEADENASPLHDLERGPRGEVERAREDER
jgi:RNA polymerase sigma-70 factor (ECF subfamily)